LISLSLLCGSNPARVNQTDIWVMITNACRKQKYDNPKLVHAIMVNESSLDAWATRYEPKWKYFTRVAFYAKELGLTVETESHHQATSWGLMQIMGGTARDMGFDEQLTTLCVPTVNIIVGITYLRHLQGRYGKNLEKIVAAWNAGSPRRDTNGHFVNQDYVDRVMETYQKFTPIFLY